MDKIFDKAAIALTFYDPTTDSETTRRFNNLIEGATETQVHAFQDAIAELSTLELSDTSVVETYRL